MGDLDAKTSNFLPRVKAQNMGVSNDFIHVNRADNFHCLSGSLATCERSGAAEEQGRGGHTVSSVPQRKLEPQCEGCTTGNYLHAWLKYGNETFLWASKRMPFDQ